MTQDAINKIVIDVYSRDKTIIELSSIKEEILDFKLMDIGDANPEIAFEAMRELCVNVLEEHINNLREGR